MQIPALGAKLFERLVEFQGRAQGRDQILDDLRLAQSLHGIACLRQRRRRMAVNAEGISVAAP
jgi:hypothetical protein